MPTKSQNIQDTSKDLEQELKASKARVAELEKLCVSYRTQAENSDKTLKRMTLEYNSRVQYMLDCVKHSYLSIQFAVNALNKGEQTND